MPDEAVLEAPATETLDVATTFSDGATETLSPEAQIDDHDEPQAGETEHLRGKELYRAVKDKLKNGEKLSAEEMRSLRRAIHVSGKADEATNGDFRNFEAERAAYQQLAQPGEESYTPDQLAEQIKADRTQLANIIQDVQAGAPTLIEEIFTDYPESAPALAIQGMQRLAQSNNELFTTYLAKSAVKFFNDKEIPLHFRLLDTFLPQKSDDPPTQAVINAINAIRSAFGELDGWSKRPIDLKKPQAQSQNGHQPAETNETHSLRRDNWNFAAAPVNQSLRDNEIKAIESSRKTQLTPAERKQAHEAIKEEFDTRISTISSVLKGYVEANNKQAYLDRVQSEGKKIIPSMVQRHVNSIIDSRIKAATNGAKPKAEAAPDTEGKKDAAGTVWISSSPASLGLQVDLNRTTNAMLTRNEAYVKGRSGLHKWKQRVA